MSVPIQSVVRTYLLEQFLPGEDPAELTGETPLITGGILDSIGTLKVVTFLEKQFGVELEAHEAGVDHLDTVDRIVELIQSKLAA